MSNLKNNKERLYDVLKKPLITEKSMIASTQCNQYTFTVAPDATKNEIAEAIKLAFPGRKVKKVRTVYMPSSQKRFGYKIGRTQSGKKAIITIEGEPLYQNI